MNLGVETTFTAQQSQGTDSGGSTTTNGTCYYDAIDESISYNKGASFFDNLTNTDEFAKDEWWNMRHFIITYKLVLCISYGLSMK